MNNEFKYVKVKVLEVRKDNYSVFAFEILNEKNEYLMCTMLPNWGIDILKGEVGVLQYQEAIAGKTTWFDRSGSLTNILHSFSANYVIDFIPISNVIEYEGKLDRELLKVN